jgi:hypothetical protein
VNGVFHSSGNFAGYVGPIPWEAFSPCATVDLTYRVYSEPADTPYREPLFSEEPLESAEVELIGNNSPGCNPAWGTGGSGGSGSITLEADRTSVSRDNPLVTLTSNGEDEALVVVFVNGVWETFYLLNQLNGQTTGWEAFAPCVTVDMEYRLYNSFVPGSPVPPYADPYDAGVLIEFVGDDTDDCNPKWGTQDAGGSGDSDEPLAKTGSDASAVAGLTSVAGVAALAVAVAVARRTRRAQR